MHGGRRGRGAVSRAPRDVPRHHGAAANMAAALGATLAMAFAAHLLVGATALDIVIAAPPFAFVVCVSLAQMDAQGAKKAEDRKEIETLGGVLGQCERALALLAKAAGAAPASPQARAGMGHLAGTIRLLATRYGRYIENNGVWAALEAESLVMTAEILGRDVGDRVGPLRDYVGVVGENVLDEDDPRLAAVRLEP